MPPQLALVDHVPSIIMHPFDDLRATRGELDLDFLQNVSEIP